MTDTGSLKDFKDLKIIGKGSFGRVYRAIRASDNQEYAIKEVPIKSMSQKEREDAVNEVRILASVNNPMVIKYYDAFIESDKLHIVTELARGGDVGAKIKRHYQRHELMHEDMIWGFFIQICQGLKALHSANILHRDIKAQNIFLVTAREIKIGDLGVAKVTKDGMAHTQIGTPYYMSPEIWKRRPYNRKSDIWSVGCLLYEMAALRHPFEARDERSLAEKVMRGVYPPIPTSYSSDLSQIIKLILTVDPSRRPSVDDLLNHRIVQERIACDKIKCAEAAEKMSAQDLVGTIKVPRQLSQLQHKLPGSKYPGSKPSTAHGQKRPHESSVPQTARDYPSREPSAPQYGRRAHERQSVDDAALIRGRSDSALVEDKENGRNKQLPNIRERRPSGHEHAAKLPYAPPNQRRGLVDRSNRHLLR